MLGIRRPVLIITDYPPRTAVSHFASLLFRGLSSRSEMVTMTYTPDESRGVTEGEWAKGLTIGTRRMSRIVNYPIQNLTFRKLRERAVSQLQRGGVVHYSTAEQKPLVAEARTIVTIHDNPLVNVESDLYSLPFHTKAIIRRHLRIFSRQSHAHVMSRYVETGLRNFGYDGPIYVVPFPVDPCFRPMADRARLRAELGLPLAGSLVLSVSTLARRKNLGTVKRVMALLGSEFQLVRVGPSIGSGTTFTAVSYETLNKIYNACDTLLFPSLEEGFGVPQIEAFAVGLPVVASNIPPLQETGNGVALLLDPTDPRALANGVKEAIANRDALFKRGLERAQSFTLANFATKMAVIYDHF
jgi:glycosyltransferase involved in cell wall biosynthesis